MEGWKKGKKEKEQYKGRKEIGEKEKRWRRKLEGLLLSKSEICVPINPLGTQHFQIPHTCFQHGVMIFPSCYPALKCIFSYKKLQGSQFWVSL